MIGKIIKALFIAGAAFAYAPVAQASAIPRATYEPAGLQTLVPFGWYDFCNRYKDQCKSASSGPKDIVLNAETLKELERINLWVNNSVKPLSDENHWGRVDQWDYPIDGYGDCEDYALMKRKLLIQEGFPQQALLMTVVLDTHDEGHAILTVKTDHGDFVLDNLDNELKPWDATGYRYVKRQSQANPNIWVNIGEPKDEPAYVSR